MNQKRVRITIGNQGEYEIKALEGFSGSSCVEQTRNIEIAIGGSEIDEGKTEDYYRPDGDNPVQLNL